MRNRIADEKLAAVVRVRARLAARQRQEDGEEEGQPDRTRGSRG